MRSYRTPMRTTTCSLLICSCFPVSPRTRSLCALTVRADLENHGTKIMEEAVCLSGLKETVALSELDRNLADRPTAKYYPFATVLRLRVLQIVCGITFLIMGTVGFIEEKGNLNLGLGIPAGAATILAAAGSLHTTRGFSGYKTSTCLPGSPLRFLGPSVQIAAPLAVLWGTALSFLVALLVQATRTLTLTSSTISLEEEFGSKKDLTILASVELVLSVLVIFAIVLLLRIDCKYDPD